MQQWANYRYNDQGIRVSSTVNSVETRYLLDEGAVAQVWEEYASNGQAEGSYVYGHDLISQSQAGQESFYLVDGLGSTRILTDQTGAVLNRYTYDAFGKTLNTSGSTENQYLFAGEQLDAATGDYYLRQRYYDADSGRFTRRDTYEGRQGEPLTLHKYLYANDNPVNRTDPSGLMSVGEVWATLDLLEKLWVVAAATTVGIMTAPKPLEPLGGFNGGNRPRTILESIFAWKNTWTPEPLGGVEGVKPNFSDHTGTPRADVVDIAQYIFESNFRGPAAKGFDWNHIVDRHSEWGTVARQSGKKDIFYGLTENQIKRTVMNAWKNREKVETQDDLVTGERRMRYRGLDSETGYEVEMWYSQDDKKVETAYPINRY